ncbi:hypothetical protein QVA66_03975 [Staphylococcus chromogenes]|nr:hypothetical protein [Staphylococcus chromogenes]
MATGTINLAEAVELELERIFQNCQQQRERREAARRTSPLVRLWDGDWKLAGIVAGEIDGTMTWVMNDTGSCVIKLPVHSHLSQWVLDHSGRDTENVHITIDKDGARWGGRLRKDMLTKTEDGQRYVELQFLHDYEELKRIQCWSNPFLPASVQFPRVSILAGPAKWVLKTMLLMNIVRLNASLWHLPDDPLDPDSWTQAFNPDEWPIVVKPGSLLSDGSPWTIASSRFKFWHDMAQPTLEDAELMVECRRFLDGDPPPWPGANLRNGTLVVDIVDKSGRYAETGAGTSGNIFTGIVRTAVKFAENLIDEDETVLPNPDEQQYRLPGWLGTLPNAPYVTYRDGAITGVEAAEFTHEPAQAVQVNAGGHSMPGVNEGVSAAVQLAGNVLGTFVALPSAGTIADTLLRPIYTDTLLAWMSIKSPIRSRRAGWSHYQEHFAKGGDRAYTLSGLIALREGFWETRARTAHKLKVTDGAPWFIGEQGYGHFFLGDRIGSTIIGLRPDRIVVERVSELTFSWSREGMGWEITVGDQRAVESPLGRTVRKVAELAATAHDLGVV